jgi:hypothetical protein
LIKLDFFSESRGGKVESSVKESESLFLFANSFPALAPVQEKQILQVEKCGDKFAHGVWTRPRSFIGEEDRV